MKNPHTPPIAPADLDIDRIVPADFPLSDDLLDLLDEATALTDAAADGTSPAVEHIQSLHIERFTLCRDLAERLCGMVRLSASVPGSPKAQADVLKWYRYSLVTCGWTSAEEAYWITHRMALWLGWAGTTYQLLH